MARGQTGGSKTTKGGSKTTKGERGTGKRWRRWEM
jgi:hypothetical protein